MDIERINALGHQVYCTTDKQITVSCAEIKELLKLATQHYAPIEERHFDVHFFEDKEQDVSFWWISGPVRNSQGGLLSNFSILMDIPTEEEANLLAEALRKYWYKAGV